MSSEAIRFSFSLLMYMPFLCVSLEKYSSYVYIWTYICSYIFASFPSNLDTFEKHHYRSEEEYFKRGKPKILYIRSCRWDLVNSSRESAFIMCIICNIFWTFSWQSVRLCRMFTVFMICDGHLFFVTQPNLEAFSICLFTVMFSNISFSLDK